MQPSSVGPRRLHYHPDSANLVIRMILEELALPFEGVFVDRERDEHWQPAYRQLNPQGLLPVLEDDGCVVFETAAIALHLVHRHPGLAPAPGTPERSAMDQWLAFLANTLHADFRLHCYSYRYTADSATIPAIRAGCRQRLRHHFALLDETIGPGTGSLIPWGITVADFYMAACARWCVLYPPGDTLHTGRPVDYPNLQRLLRTLECRPAVVRACAAEGITGAVFTAPEYPKRATRTQ